MNHKRLHKRIVDILTIEGNLCTGEILDELRSTKTEPGRKYLRSGNNLYDQPINVIINVLKRKPIIKIGFDQSARQAVWGIIDSE